MENNDLPDGWTIAKIRDTGEYINGRGFKKSEWEGEGRPIIRIQNLTGTADAYNYSTLEVDEKYVIPPETILVSWSATLDAFLWRGPEAVLNQHIFKVVPDEDIVEKGFLFWLLKREIQEMKRSAKLQGSTMKHIRRDPFLDHEFPLPPLAEQRRIADRLDAIQSHTRKARETLSQLPRQIEEYRQSVLNAAFTGQLTADWREDHTDIEPAAELLERILEERRKQWENDYRAKYEKKGEKPPSGWEGRYSPPSGIDTETLSDCPTNWKWTSLDQLLNNLRNGYSKAPRAESGLQVLRISSVRPMSVDIEDVRYLAEKPDNYEKYLIEEGYLLFIRYNGNENLVGVCGKVPELESEYLHPDKLIRGEVAAPQLVSPAFLEIVLNTGRSRIHIRSQVKSTSGQSGISQDVLYGAPVPLPPAEEQKEIVRRVRQRLDKIDEMEAKVETAQAHLDHLDRSVLAKAFCGELVETEAARAEQEGRDYESAEELLQRVREGEQIAMEME
jgi:type I restriction enzyme S subunit